MDNYYSAKASLNIAFYFDNKNFLDSAFHYYNLSKAHFLKIKDSSQVGRRLMSMGIIQQSQNDFVGSKETLTEALQFLNPQKDSRYIASSYNALATNHRKLLNYQDAEKYYRKAIQITDAERDKRIYLNNIAVTYVDYNQYRKAIEILRVLSQDSVLVGNQKEHARVLDNLAYAQWSSGKRISEENFLKPLKIRKQYNDGRGQISSYTHLGEFYSEENPQKAKLYFDSVIRLSKKMKIPRAEKDALRFLMDLEPKGLRHRDRYIFLQDSLYAQELKVKTQFAKYKYDDQLKQESILRLEKENAEKELEAGQQRNQKIIYLGGLLFITSVLGLSLYGFRQRTKLLKQESKAEKLEAIQETEAQLSRKLHDDHGGKINQAMLMLQRGTDKSDILDKLESVYTQIRSFSREINTVDTGPDFWNSLKATLEYLKPVEVEMIFDGGKELDWSLVADQTKTIIFKVLQELIMNLSQHSKANQTVILFREKKKELSIYYEDDGVGASKKSLLRKNGLRNTEKRIQALGGSIIFDSEEGKGFRAKIRIPK
nr:tetratricopeptide repeat-containing sensor histidine kinase [uncultured Allomuricauda sp.]